MQEIKILEMNDIIVENMGHTLCIKWCLLSKLGQIHLAIVVNLLRGSLIKYAMILTSPFYHDPTKKHSLCVS